MVEVKIKCFDRDKSKTFLELSGWWRGYFLEIWCLYFSQKISNFSDAAFHPTAQLHNLTSQEKRKDKTACTFTVKISVTLRCQIDE